MEPPSSAATAPGIGWTAVPCEAQRTTLSRIAKSVAPASAKPSPIIR